VKVWDSIVAFPNTPIGRETVELLASHGRLVFAIGVVVAGYLTYRAIRHRNLTTIAGDAVSATAEGLAGAAGLGCLAVIVWLISIPVTLVIGWVGFNSVEELWDFAAPRAWALGGSVFSKTVVLVVIAIGIALALQRVPPSIWLAFDRRRRESLSLTGQEWKTVVKASRPDVQSAMLRRSQNDATEAFLVILRELEPSISEEPALSAYWSLRNEVEQELKQTRVG
jgi:hypothetical protein